MGPTSWSLGLGFSFGRLRRTKLRYRFFYALLLRATARAVLAAGWLCYCALFVVLGNAFGGDLLSDLVKGAFGVFLLVGLGWGVPRLLAEGGLCAVSFSAGFKFFSTPIFIY